VFYVHTNTLKVIWETVFTGQKTQPSSVRHLHANIFNEVQTVLNVDGNRSSGTSLTGFSREKGCMKCDNGTTMYVWDTSTRSPVRFRASDERSVLNTLWQPQWCQHIWNNQTINVT